MDPLTAPVVLTALKTALDSASGEAGRQVWHGFAALVRRALGRDDTTGLGNVSGSELATIDPARAESIATIVAETAQRDPDFATALRAWLEQANLLAVRIEDNSVVNTIGDQAKIGGNLVQARDITGPINFS